MRNFLLRRRNDERGAILIIATVGVVLAVVASALAVDLGTLAQERRRDQKIADLAALDAARDMPNMQVRAEQSAMRNGFPNGPGYAVTAIEGVKSNGQCLAVAGSGKVCVTVISPHKNNFLPGNQTVVARAVAGSISAAKFCMGSSLASASLDHATDSLPILNRVFGRFLGGPTGQANVLSYKGLADANVQLRQLQAALGFGTVNEMMTTDITMGQLLHATGVVLNNQGTAAALAAYNDIVRLENTTTSTAKFKLGDYISIAQGMEEKALDGQFNVFQLITAGAQLANKNNLIDAGAVMDIPVNLGSLGNSTLSTKLAVKVIEAPQCYIGPETDASGAIRTSQMEVTMTPHIDVEFTSPLFNVLSLLVQVGTADLRLKGDFPVKYSAGGALGYLEDVRCSATPGITVDVTSLPVTTHAEGHLAIFAEAVTSFITGNVKINVDVTPTDVSSTQGGPYDVVFNHPNDFTMPDPDGQTTPGAPVGVTMTPSNVNTTVGAAGITQVLGLVTGTLKLDVVESAIIGPILNPVFNAVANRLTTPALKALGVAVGPVDVTAPADGFDAANCGQPGLLQ